MWKMCIQLQDSLSRSVLHMRPSQMNRPFLWALNHSCPSSCPEHGGWVPRVTLVSASTIQDQQDRLTAIPTFPSDLTYQLCIHITTDAPTYPLTYPPSNWCSHLPSDAPIYLLMYPPNYYTRDFPTCWLIHPHNNWHTFLSTNIPTYPLMYPPTDILAYLLTYSLTRWVSHLPSDTPTSPLIYLYNLPTYRSTYRLMELSTYWS